MILFCAVARLKVPTMIVFDVATRKKKEDARKKMLKLLPSQW